MRLHIKYEEIERRYKALGDKSDKEFCKNAGINGSTYYTRKYIKGKGMSLIVALLIAEYLNCDVKDFCEINWKI